MGWPKDTPSGVNIQGKNAGGFVPNAQGEPGTPIGVSSERNRCVESSGWSEITGGAASAVSLTEYVMKSYIRAAAFFVALLHGGLATAQVENPFEAGVGFVPANPIDERVAAGWARAGIEPADLCSDAVFLRRVRLDLTGTLPSPDEVKRFLDDPNPAKRAALIDALMNREEFADYWAMKWCDLLRVKAEFPINLWPNAVQAYHRWIRDAVCDNMPYDRFTRELLTSSGSNFRVAPVNFYRAVQSREPAGIADAVALTFMGVRLDTWPEDHRVQMAAFFSRIAYKKTSEWKEEIVGLDPAPAGPLNVVFPDGVAMTIPADKDPREVFAAWLIAPDNPWFARNIVNRAWSWFFCRGIIHEPDDIRPDNPPSNPELLAYLEQAFVDGGYDLRQLFRLILNSATYQQSSMPRSGNPQVEALFACYPVRRIEAEVLIDALGAIFGGGEQYESPIPEPFTFVPEYQRTIALADGSISSPFLELFGRPPRDTGLESERNNQPTDAQRLHLINSSQVQRRIEQSPRLRGLLKTNKKNPRNAIRALYVSILSRRPTPDELAAIDEYARTSDLNPQQIATDLAWALINSREFLYRH